ncbi:uncharacterized protein LOC129943276 [Eupeodes corollae]|uniref:uncharacterized protein LOC129943276 n=1 Tax=Eupeodes corollae TaxID=290404 RepID=UPI0024931083|nr:uncharacterized protein LOC129943276 [Eupeodes corollae]
MEEILKESERIFEKINLIESVVSLNLRRSNIEPQIQELAQKTEEVKSLIQQCNQVMKVEYSNVMNEHKLIMRKLQQQQLKALEVLIERKQSAKEDEQKTKQLLHVRGAPTAATNVAYGTTPLGVLKEKQPKSISKHLAVKSVQKLDTVEGKMYLEDYLQSPFVRKTKPLSRPFQFIDFEAEITSEIFESIPKYMRGRETVEELKNFLDTVLVPCFNEKYQLLHRHRDCIRNHVDLDMWKLYNDQASYFPGQNFITQGDISRRIKKMLDKKSQNKITMLRHLGILQEQRKAQTVCYIWTANNI